MRRRVTFSPCATTAGASEIEMIAPSRIESEVPRSATSRLLSAVKSCMSSVVNFSRRPGSPNPDWSSTSGIAMVFRCAGTDAPVNEYTHPSARSAIGQHQTSARASPGRDMLIPARTP
jgi:hypothetical protein